ncbi:gp436 family protein [Roseobacter sp. S98]|uniref:gp436 family protein n=1 Tax=Roseobacter algicola (ex Choi et al. 2025) (nom. illeg.) TaxID=3092138 RepID=UPI0035C6E71E
MPYTTLSDLTARFGENLLVQLTDRGDVATDTIDQTVIDQAISDTDALIDGYLAKRYALPMAAVPPLVASLALDIAIYKLHIFEANPKIEADYKAAMKSLEGIAAGSVTLPVEGAEAAGSGSSGARLTDRDRPLTETSLKGFI